MNPMTSQYGMTPPLAFGFGFAKLIRWQAGSAHRQQQQQQAVTTTDAPKTASQTLTWAGLVYCHPVSRLHARPT
ncbi:uncharacterized protein CTRU02_214250 [Colletotrichum truncatum]|uniref:Uncharacterized protein n=1 Tax=Colletotrichum truncatum TaxID=5467 RepID=A0ACC3YI21_COLTU